jgi:FkbM family methyltransferase
MLNYLKTILYRLYCAYYERVPLNKGKYTAAKALKALLGDAVFNVNGFRMALNVFAMHDRYLIAGSGLDGVVRECCEAILPKGGVFLDVGANAGYFSLMAASFPGVSVLAFEPSPRELKRLHRNIELNGMKNITVFPFGLSSQNESLALRLSPDYIPVMNSVLHLGPSDETVLCEFHALDEVVPPEQLRQVTLCKIDVEGHELSVLHGMQHAMDHLRNAVFVVEISPGFLALTGRQPPDIYDFFAGFGFYPKIGIQPKSQWDEVFSRTTTGT